MRCSACFAFVAVALAGALAQAQDLSRAVQSNSTPVVSDDLLGVDWLDEEEKFFPTAPVVFDDPNDLFAHAKELYETVGDEPPAEPRATWEASVRIVQHPMLPLPVILIPGVTFPVMPCPRMRFEVIPSQILWYHELAAAQVADPARKKPEVVDPAISDPVKKGIRSVSYRVCWETPLLTNTCYCHSGLQWQGETLPPHFDRFVREQQEATWRSVFAKLPPTE